MKFKQVLIPLAILAGGFFIMLILLQFKTEPPKRQQNITPKIVETAVVRLDTISSEIVAYGRLASIQPVVLYSEVNGTLEAGTIPFLPGQSFKKGDLLVKVDHRQARYDLNSTKSDFLNALAAVLPEIKVDFPAEYQRYQDYFDQCSFDESLKPLPETKSEKVKIFLTRFNVYKLYYAVKNMEIRLDKHFFYAPFKGSVVATDLRVGSSARAGSRIGEIINLENMEVEVPVATADVRWIDFGKRISFSSSELSGSWHGRINRIGKNVDERTQTVPVYISIAQNGNPGLYNGVFLEAHIPGKTIADAFSVPRRLLYDEQFVYLVEQGKLDYRKVDIARREKDSVIISGGLQNGDTLVTEVLQGVASGMPARPRESLDEGGTP